MSRLMIVDDDKNVRVNLAKFFESCGHGVTAVDSTAAVKKVLVEERTFDVVLTNFEMAGINGLELLRQIKRRHPETQVILMTADGTIEHAVECIKAGAFHYITKPFVLAEIRHLVDLALEMGNLRSQIGELRSTIDESPCLDSESELVQVLLQIARQAARSDDAILLTGESGTGKSTLARQIHEWSPRANRPFVTVNCTVLSENLIESEMFGQARGSFRGALKDKLGRLETADGGTLFLDDVADLTPGLQTKLLRFLEEQRFERVGAQRTIHVNTRIISATNHDLEQEVSAGRFSAALCQRLNAITLIVPPLRERPEDILPLAKRFLSASSVVTRGRPIELSAEAARALTEYPWPGNIRELRNTVERAAVLSGGEAIEKDDLPGIMFHPQPNPVDLPRGGAAEEVEAGHLRGDLSQTPFHQAAASSDIDIASPRRKRTKPQFD